MSSYLDLPFTANLVALRLCHIYIYIYLIGLITLMPWEKALNLAQLGFGLFENSDLV